VIIAVAKYYSPNGKSIPDNGVTPSVAENEDAPASDVEDDSGDQPDTAAPKPAGDHLMERAVKVLNGGK
jgi:C-terminal processing protease CtpA/Prc